MTPKIPNLPIEGPAVSAGPADENETTPPEQRVATPKQALADGPKRGARGEYLPASYKTQRGNIRTDR